MLFKKVGVGDIQTQSVHISNNNDWGGKVGTPLK